MRRLRLLSTATRFVSLGGWRSAIELTGSRLHPLTVSSWDSGRGGPDPRPEDGRASILARGSSMTAMTATFSHLGFGDGRTSGVAWAGLAPTAGLGPPGRRPPEPSPTRPSRATASAPSATRPRT